MLKSINDTAKKCPTKGFCMPAANTIACNNRTTSTQQKSKYTQATTMPMTTPGEQAITAGGFFFKKKIDQSNCSVSLGKWCHRDGRDTTWPITNIFFKHAVLNMVTYKKIRVQWILIKFVFPHGNRSDFIREYMIYYSYIFKIHFNLIFGSVSGQIRIRHKIL